MVKDILHLSTLQCAFFKTLCFRQLQSNLNLYDALCNLHHNSRAPHAHFGPAFLSWHRVALYV